MVENYLTVAEVAELMKVATRTVKRVLASGELSSVKFGNSVRVRQSDLDNYINRNAKIPA